jgi:hypothetical protein
LFISREPSSPITDFAELDKEKTQAKTFEDLLQVCIVVGGGNLGVGII